MNYTYNPPAGLTINKVANTCVRLTVAYGCNVDLIFNGMLIVVTPQHTEEDILKLWELETNLQ